MNPEDSELVDTELILHAALEGEPALAELLGPRDPGVEDELRRFFDHAQRLQRQGPKWRQGQALFNALERWNMDWANEIRGTRIDPFFLDSRIPRFTEWLRSRIKEAGPFGL